MQELHRTRGFNGDVLGGKNTGKLFTKTQSAGPIIFIGKN